MIVMGRKILLDKGYTLATIIASGRLALWEIIRSLGAFPGEGGSPKKVDCKN